MCCNPKYSVYIYKNQKIKFASRFPKILNLIKQYMQYMYTTITTKECIFILHLNCFKNVYSCCMNDLLL